MLETARRYSQQNKLLFCLISILYLYIPAVQAQGVAISARFGSLGIGFELTKSLLPTFNTRIGGNFYKYGIDGIEGENLKYDLNVKIRTISLLFDWYPIDKKFHISTGAFYNKNSARINLESASSIIIGAKTYSPEELGNIEGNVEFNTISPYIGIGLGNAVDDGKKLGFKIDLGIIYQNSPNLTLIGTGAITPTTEQEPLIEDNLSWAKWYPNLSIGLSWKF